MSAIPQRHYVTAAEIQKRAVDKKKAKGMKTLQVWLDPEDIEALTQFQRSNGIATRADAIRSLLSLAQNANAPAETGA